MIERFVGARGPRSRRHDRQHRVAVHGAHHIDAVDIENRVDHLVGRGARRLLVGTLRHGHLGNDGLARHRGHHVDAHAKHTCNREHQQTHGNQQGQSLVAQEELKRTAIGIAQVLKPARLGRLHVLEHVRGDRGHKRKGHKQRRGKHISDGERKRHEQLTHETRGENRRQKHAYRGERGGHNGTRDLLGALYRSARRRNAAAAQAVDVLQHNDGVVHEHADGQRDAAKSEDVDRETGEVHEDERAQHRERDGERHDERGLHRLKEQGKNHNGQARTQNQ